MAHDFVKDMLDQEEGRAGFRIMFTLSGGILLLTSLVAERIYSHSFHATMIAMVAALLLGVPLVWQALVDLWCGKSQVNELAALAVLAAFVSGAYVMAGALRFLCLSRFLSNGVPLLVHARASNR